MSVSEELRHSCGHRWLSIYTTDLETFVVHYGVFSACVLQRKRLYSSADKTFVLGTNFGPYRNSWYKKLYSDIFNKYVTDICFRDQYTFQLFKSDEHIRVAPDIFVRNGISTCGT